MGKMVKGIKYMILSSHSNSLNIQSFENITYITLMEIFLNADAYNTCMLATHFNDQLTGGILFEERTSNFQYTNVLYEKKYIRELSYWLNSLNEDFFQFTEEDISLYDDDNNTYMLFDEWWENFESLKKILNKRVSEIALQTTRNLWIPRDYEIQNIHHL